MVSSMASAERDLLALIGGIKLCLVGFEETKLPEILKALQKVKSTISYLPKITRMGRSFSYFLERRKKHSAVY
jgi:hypothetical protein